MKRFVLFLLFSLLNAEVLEMRPGESQIFKTKKPIATVFASDPKVFDYKIINSRTIAVYSLANGYGEVIAFGENKEGNETLLKIQANIDSDNANLMRIAKLIESQNPNSSITLKKLTVANNNQTDSKKGYIISGSVPDEESKDKAYLTAATALGLTLKRDGVRKQSAVVTSQQGVSLGNSALSGGNENLEFLEKHSVDGLVNNLIITSPRQVNVKLIIADVEKGIVEKLGINYNNGGIFKIPLLNPGSNFIQSIQSGINIEAIVEAIKDDSIAKILATPNISVLSGESASVQVTSQYTPISTTISNNGNAVSSPQTPVDYGVSLTVQPKVFSKNKIILNISQEVSNIQSIIERSGASAANLKKRRTQSVIELADGDSFILGGLVDERDIEQVKSVPFLGDIPLLGLLFRHTTFTRSKTELLVIATINITEPNSKNFIDLPTFSANHIAQSFFAIPQSWVRSNKSDEDLKYFVANIGFIK